MCLAPAKQVVKGAVALPLARRALGGLQDGRAAQARAQQGPNKGRACRLRILAELTSCLADLVGGPRPLWLTVVGQSQLAAAETAHEVVAATTFRAVAQLLKQDHLGSPRQPHKGSKGA